MTNIAVAVVRMIAAGLPGRAVIDGQMVAAGAGGTLPVHSPRDGAIVGQIPDCGVADVDTAVAAARRVFEAGHWSRMAPRARKALLLRLADLVADHAEELAMLETIDTGKPIADTRAVDIPLALGTLRYYAEAIDKVYGEVGPSGEDRLSWAVHEPLGVIGAIVPWNFPLHMAMWKIAPALAMGNSVVVKPSELSSLTAIRFGELALEAGLPAGVLNIVPGRGQVAGDALARHMDVDMIAFTGSGPTGRALMRASADSNLKRVSLELGGKSPHIVLADCPDLDRAASQAAWGIFYNQGQVCTAGSRLLVAREIRDAFVEKLLNVARTIVPGDPYDAETRLGAIINDGQLARVSRFVEQAREEGGGLLLGGASVAPVVGGWFHEPTIFEVDRHATLAREEVFGPVLAVIEFDGPEEALEIANDTPFGLASGVWTGSMEQANHFARRLRAGLVWVNGWDACDITMPFGGFKQSGFGRDRSLHALHKYADMKAVSVSFAS